MAHLPTIPPILWLLLLTICSAQTDTTDDLTYRFSLGIAPGISLPLRNAGLCPGDPIYLLDSAVAHGAFAMTYSYRLTPTLTLELVVDGLLAGNGPEISVAQRELAEATYPDHFLVVDNMSRSDLLIAAGGSPTG